MGNSGSGAETAPGSASGRPAKKGQGKTGESTKRLLDYYTVGEMLGQGTFGVVYACKPKGQDRECAVKMVDKVETPVDKIKEEADFLRKMNHPNVIKCYDVIYEKCFVCIVMDRLKGGDLILGMQAHWKSAGRIPFKVSSRIAGQMADSLRYLHDQNMIHRDIKGDNYLTDRKDITDPACRVVLTDFGTGLQISPGQRLHEKCGTKLYWSPEFFKMDYSTGVDIWACGVVCYGLLCGRFPFRNEVEANKKALTFSADTPTDAQDLAQGMLAKTEDKRITAGQVMDHPFIKKSMPEPAAPAKVEAKAPEKPASTKQDEEALMKELGADHGVQDRRFELVERLMNAKSKITPAKSTFVPSATGTSEDITPGHYWKETFTVVDKRQNNSTIRYEWWSPDQISAELEGVPEGGGMTKLDGATEVNLGAEAEASELCIKQQLEEHGIDTSAFGKGEAKTLKQLAAEVQSGAAVLMLDATEHKKLVRVVDVVALRICAPGAAEKFLIETEEVFSDGRKRSTNRLPGTKKEPHENTKQTAERIVADMLDLGANSKVTFDYENAEVFEEEDISPSYPGVCTVYRKVLVEGRLQAGPGVDQDKFESSVVWSKKDTTGNTKFFLWLERATCEEKEIEIEKPSEDDETSALVQAPIGLNEEALTTYLQGYKVDITEFGKGKAKTLEAFSNELTRGESSLCHSTDGSIMRVVDVVLLKLKNAENGKILVQSLQTYPDGAEVKLNRLPGTKRRPDENQFLTARTIVQRQLKINDNHVTCSAKDVQAVEEEKPSLAYPGLRTVYRKRIVQATLSKD